MAQVQVLSPSRPPSPAPTRLSLIVDLSADTATTAAAARAGSSAAATNRICPVCLPAPVLSPTGETSQHSSAVTLKPCRLLLDLLGICCGHCDCVSLATTTTTNGERSAFLSSSFLIGDDDDDDDVVEEEDDNNDKGKGKGVDSKNPSPPPSRSSSTNSSHLPRILSAPSRFCQSPLSLSVASGSDDDYPHDRGERFSPVFPRVPVATVKSTRVNAEFVPGTEAFRFTSGHCHDRIDGPDYYGYDSDAGTDADEESDRRSVSSAPFPLATQQQQQQQPLPIDSGRGGRGWAGFPLRRVINSLGINGSSSNSNPNPTAGRSRRRGGMKFLIGPSPEDDEDDDDDHVNDADQDQVGTIQMAAGTAVFQNGDVDISSTPSFGSRLSLAHRYFSFPPFRYNDEKYCRFL